MKSYLTEVIEVFKNKSIKAYCDDCSSLYAMVIYLVVLISTCLIEVLIVVNVDNLLTRCQNWIDIISSINNKAKGTCVGYIELTTSL